MLRTTFLADPDVNSFVHWLAGQLTATAPPIVFPVIPKFPVPPYGSLSAALGAYSWPPARNDIPIPIPPSPRVLAAGSSLATNTAFLSDCERGLRTSLACGRASLSDWIYATWKWGGVAGPASQHWLHSHPGLLAEVAGVTHGIAGLIDDDSHALGLPVPYRFNSGMSKVYSLLDNELIIYDSRVAKALACLVVCSTGSGLHPPSPFLHFRQPPRRGHPGFPGFAGTNNNPDTYLMWNIRATWILCAALGIANKGYVLSGSIHLRQRLRDLEAALFMLGD